MSTIVIANQVPTSIADTFYRIKEMLVTFGCVVTSSGTGTAGSYNSSGDSIASGTMNNNRAWYVMTMVGGGFLCVQNTGGATNARIKYSPSAGFVGGSPSEDTVPSATDELVFRGGGTDASPSTAIVVTATAPNILCLSGDNVTGSWVIFGHYDSGSGFGLASIGWFLDRLVPGSYSPSDPAPVVFQALGAAAGSGAFSTIAFTTSNVTSGLTHDGFPRTMFAMRYSETTTLRIPGGPFDLRGLKDDVFPLFWGRFESGGQSPGKKGRSSLFRWPGRSGLGYGSWGRERTTKDHLVVGDVLIPWDGSTSVTTCGAETLLTPLSDEIRSISIVQATDTAQPAIVDGPPGTNTKARHFDGGDKLVSGTTTAFDRAMAQGQWTVEAFVRPDSLASQICIMAMCGTTGETSAHNAQMRLDIQTSGRLAAIWESGSGTNQVFNGATGTAMVTGTWYHVAAVKNATHVRLYVNGVFYDEHAWATNTDGGTSTVWCIGVDASDGSTFMNGAMRDIRISNIARSDGEIAASAALLATTAMHPRDVNTWVLWRLGGAIEFPIVDIDARLRYRMRGKVSGNPVYWNATFVDSAGSEYLGGGSLSDIVVVGALP